MMKNDGEHIPVLFRESIDLLNVREGGIYVDLTLGRAGHSSEILRRVGRGRLIAFDLDDAAIASSKRQLEEISDNFTLVKANFSLVREKLLDLGIDAVDGILADIGVSSPQFDDPERGFSYRNDAKLDMRMDQQQTFSAHDLVNSYSEKELERVLREYGEERYAKAIAKRICQQRSIKPIDTTFELVQVIKDSMPSRELAKKGHPAKRSFQAIRIEVNAERRALEKLLEVGPFLLRPQGRMCIITFMSGDDRLVKRRFHELSETEGNRYSPDFLLPESSNEFTLLTRKPIIPGEEEEESNRRSHSAKLRGIERK